MKVPRLLFASCLLAAAAPSVTLAAPTPAQAAATPAASATPTPDVTAELNALKSADELFDYVKKYATLDDISVDEKLDRAKQMATVKEIVGVKIAHLRPAITQFLKQYPQDPRRWDVQLMRLFFLKDEDSISDEEAQSTIKAIAAAPDASPEARHQARGSLLQNSLEEADPAKGLTDDLEKEMTAYEKDFPDDPSGAQLVATRVRLLSAAAPDKVNVALETLAKSPNKATADTARTRLDMLTKPLELKFTSATDGKPFDLADLRGKVVLLDFWATWCGPCMAKLPEIQKINKKYAGKDFQLVGISLDQDKAALEKTLKAKGMDWPEYFDGKGWQSDVGTRFGVESIPAAWLVDKKGIVHPVDQEADLEAEIAKLIADKG